jgi:hypothetical protein
MQQDKERIAKMVEALDRHEILMGKCRAELMELTGSRSENFKLQVLDDLEVKCAEISTKAMVREEELLRAISRRDEQYQFLHDGFKQFEFKFIAMDTNLYKVQKEIKSNTAQFEFRMIGFVREMEEAVKIATERMESFEPRF